MGFSMQLTILRPERYTLTTEGTDEERGHMTVWTPSGFMEGYASWGGAGAQLPTGEYCAELCTISWLFRYVSLRAQKPHRRLFAPPFVPSKGSDGLYRFSGPRGWLAENAANIPPGTQLMLPWWDSYKETIFPNEEEQLEHNAVLQLSERKYRKWRERMTFDPTDDVLSGRHVGTYWDGGMFTPPYMWVSCAQVAMWLRELERGQLVNSGRTQQVLRRDRDALAIVKARQAYLFHLGKIGYRVLFTFGNGTLPKAPFL